MDNEIWRGMTPRKMILSLIASTVAGLTVCTLAVYFLYNGVWTRDMIIGLVIGTVLGWIFNILRD